MHLRIFCDGGARGNPGPAGIGVVIKDEGEKIIHRFGKRIGVATNNVAEYTAVIEALSWIIKNVKPLRINFYLDSQLVVSQLNGLFKIKNTKLRELLMQIREKEGELSVSIFYKQIPREQNLEADSLVNKALDYSSGK